MSRPAQQRGPVFYVAQVEKARTAVRRYKVFSVREG